MSTARALTTDLVALAAVAPARRRRWPAAVVAMLLALSVCLPLLDDLGTHHHSRGGVEVTHDHFHLGPHSHGWTSASAAPASPTATSPSHRTGVAGTPDETAQTPPHHVDDPDHGHSHGGAVHRHGASGAAHSHDHGPGLVLVVQTEFE